MYEIMTKHLGGWISDGVGAPNEFDSEEEAWAAVAELRKLGEDWATAEYDVREVR